MAYYEEDHYSVRDYTEYAIEMREEARERSERYNDWLEDLRGGYLAGLSEYKEHCCHGAGCDAEPAQTRQCEECGVCFCADHLAGNKCAACIRKVFAAEKRAA
jgi:hypothetical protein